MKAGTENVLVVGVRTPFTDHIADPFRLHDETTWHVLFVDHSGFPSHAHTVFVMDEP